MKDVKKAAIIYFTASNFYPFAKLQKEKDIVNEMLADLGEQAEKAATEQWQLAGFEDNVKLPTLKLTALQFQESSINKDQLRGGLKTAVGSSPQGHGSQNGGHSSWGDHFANTATEAISGTFDELLSSIGNALTPEAIENPVNKFFIDFKKSFDQTLKGAFNSIGVMEKRNDLLWWKESLYSVVLKTGYRELNTNLLPVAMAYDLSGLIPEIPPASVDSLLKETVLLLDKEAYSETTFESWLTKLIEPENKSVTSELLTAIQTQRQRINFCDYLSLLINGVADIATFKTLTGIAPKATTTPARIAVMLFHDFVAKALTLNGK